MPSKPKPYNHRQQEARRKAYDKARGNAHDRGYDNAWRRYAKAYLNENPWCYYCKLRGIETLATCVDHVAPLSKFPNLKMDPSNHRPACASCNAKKA